MRHNTKRYGLISLLAASLALAGCNGGSSSAPAPAPSNPPAPTPSNPTPPPSNPTPTPSPTPSPATYSIGGSVSGLASGAWVVLLNNGGDNLTVSNNGTFTFSKPQASGSNYAVTIGQQPMGQTCTVSQGSDAVVANNVTSVQVSCVNNTPPPAATHSVGGTVSGLNPNAVVTLQINGDDTTPVSANGTFTFANRVAEGANYSVTINLQPTGQTCTVSNGSGTMGTSNISNVDIACITPGMTVLHSFAGAPNDGNYPQAGLLMDTQGNLIGTTHTGGANNLGTVFSIAPDGTETLIHSFAGGTGDGETPIGGLVMDSHGNLFGTASRGGSKNYGVVYKLTPDGQGGYTESVFYSFNGGVVSGGTDGQYPQSTLTIGAHDTLYGATTSGGSANSGVVFELSPAGTERVLYQFTSAPSSVAPQASLIQDASGNLYGTTPFGGDYGKGTVFRVAPDGSYTLLWSLGNGTDAASSFTSLCLDPTTGALYGTTALGGTNGNGAIFKLTPDATAPTGYAETVLYSFNGPTDGKLPFTGLLLDPSGNLYGTTYAGGAFGGGTLFKITTSGSFGVLYAFAGQTQGDGATPYGDLIRDSSGYLYGTTYYGGSGGNNGSVYRFYP